MISINPWPPSPSLANTEKGFANRIAIMKARVELMKMSRFIEVSQRSRIDCAWDASVKIVLMGNPAHRHIAVNPPSHPAYDVKTTFAIQSRRDFIVDTILFGFTTLAMYAHSNSQDKRERVEAHRVKGRIVILQGWQ